MNAEQLGLLRIAILRALLKAEPLSLPFATIHDFALDAGFGDLTHTALAAELSHLVKKGWVDPKENSFSPGQKRWEISADGRDEMERQGLV